jgi:ubiquitin carboxyl-terminal hydrolase 8
LSSISLFRTWLIKGDYVELLKKDLKRESIIEQLALLYKQIWTDFATISPKTIKKIMEGVCDTFKGNEQQDSNEFLNVLLDTVHNEVSVKKEKDHYKVGPEKIHEYSGAFDSYKIKFPEMSDEDRAYWNKCFDDYRKDNIDVIITYSAHEYWKSYIVGSNSIITDLFTGLYYSSVICDVCNNITSTFEPFTILTLDINESKTTTLDECLKDFIKVEHLTETNKFDCTNCKKETDARKQFCIWELPKILIVQFKRFKNVNEHIYGDYNWNSTTKITTKVDFPLENLEMRPYLCELHNNVSTKYDLCCTSNHSSKTCNVGHYIAYCKNDINKFWYKYDDTDVHYVPEADLKEKIVTEDAYILFYVRK